MSPIGVSPPQFPPNVDDGQRPLSCYPFLVRPELESSGVMAQAGGGAGEPIASDIGGLPGREIRRKRVHRMRPSDGHQARPWPYDNTLVKRHCVR